MEVASAETYWQVPDASAIYAAPFKDHHAVGMTQIAAAASGATSDGWKGL
jgi:hypothetical protein